MLGQYPITRFSRTSTAGMSNGKCRARGQRRAGTEAGGTEAGGTEAGGTEAGGTEGTAARVAGAAGGTAAGGDGATTSTLMIEPGLVVDAGGGDGSGAGGGAGVTCASSATGDTRTARELANVAVRRFKEKRALTLQVVASRGVKYYCRCIRGQPPQGRKKK
jgi:hypothetical protein